MRIQLRHAHSLGIYDQPSGQPPGISLIFKPLEISKIFWVSQADFIAIIDRNGQIAITLPKAC